MQFRAHRWPCRHPVMVAWAGRQIRATFGNIAAGGGLLIGLEEVRPGDRLVVQLPGGSRSAEVRWVGAQRCGIRFAQPLATSELDLIRGRPVRGKRYQHLRVREMG